MTLFGYHITTKDWRKLFIIKSKEVISLEKVLERKMHEYNELNGYYQTLQKKHADTTSELMEVKDRLDLRTADLAKANKELERHCAELADISERLEKEQSDNCELQNLYAEKCKECELLDEKLKSYEHDGYVVVKEDHYDQLKADAEKFRAEREKHNANRRRRRAAKKVAQGKAE